MHIAERVPIFFPSKFSLFLCLSKVVDHCRVTLKVYYINMANQSTITPLLLHAFKLYRRTFGLLLPVVADLKLTSNHVVQLKYYGKKSKTKHEFSWFGCLIVVLLFVQASVIVLLKKLLFPSSITLQVVEIIIIIMCDLSWILAVAFWFILFKHKNDFPLLNTFFERGFFLGKLLYCN